MRFRTGKSVHCFISALTKKKAVINVRGPCCGFSQDHQGWRDITLLLASQDDASIEGLPILWVQRKSDEIFKRWSL